MKEESNRFSTRFALLASMLGVAVGTGNIWRFPRIAAQNGGSEGAGAFLIAWVACLLTWSIPLIIAEYAIGRSGRLGVVGSVARLVGKRLAGMGAFVALVATGILFYYSVVAGWCLFYWGRTLVTALPTSAVEAKSVWDGLHGGPMPVICHLIVIGSCYFAVRRGVASIERVNQFLVPALLAIVLIAAVRALTLPGALAGVAYLFTPEWSSLAKPRLWLEALTQNAWDTGAGWGLILSYAAYMRRKDFVVKNAVVTAVGNNIVSLIAALMVISTAFAVLGNELGRGEVIAVMKDSGPASTGLTFVWMPQLFAQMTGGRVLAVLFFFALTCAALSSLISMVELSTRVLVDAGIARQQALLGVIGVGFFLGVPSALNLDVLANQDFVWGVALIISGALIAIVVARHGAAKLRRGVLDEIANDWRLGCGWQVAITWLVPIQAIVLLGWWIYLSVSSYAPETWYNPLDPYSVATCVVQWGVGGSLSVALARWLTKAI